MARLGDQVDVYCGRCKVERYHTVAAIGSAGRIERIVCGYCHTPRKYKDPSTAPPRTAGASTAPRARRKVEAGPDPFAAARPYLPSVTYDKGDVIAHGKYGRGRITEVRGDRIDVRFADGTERTFLHTPRGE